jgi:hypothetical protein
MIYPYDDNYIVGFTGTQSPFAQEVNDMETSGARFYAGKQGLHEVDAIYYNHRPSILTLKTADKDWVFSIYSGSLTTDSEARHLNIVVPSGQLQFDAETSIYFMTGPCIKIR